MDYVNKSSEFWGLITTEIKKLFTEKNYRINLYYFSIYLRYLLFVDKINKVEGSSVLLYVSNVFK